MADAERIQRVADEWRRVSALPPKEQEAWREEAMRQIRRNNLRAARAERRDG